MGGEGDRERDCDRNCDRNCDCDRDRNRERNRNGGGGAIGGGAGVNFLVFALGVGGCCSSADFFSSRTPELACGFGERERDHERARERNRNRGGGGIRGGAGVSFPGTPDLAFANGVGGCCSNADFFTSSNGPFAGTPELGFTFAEVAEPCSITHR